MTPCTIGTPPFLSDVRFPMVDRLRQARLLLVLFFVLLSPAFSQQAASGQAVLVRWEGINYPAHLTAAADGRYHVRYDEHREGRPDEEWVGVDRLRNKDYSPFQSSASAAGTAAPAAPAKVAFPDVVPAGRYACYVFISGTGLVNNGEFTLFAGGSYERGGTRGRFAYVPGTGRVTFHGGVMNGRAAQYEARTLPTLHLMGNAGRVLSAGEERPVATCERKNGS